MSLTLGIDIGGTKIAAAVVDAQGKALRVRQCATEANRGGAHVLLRALELASELLAEAPQCARIGIGAGGQIDAERGVVVSATDILPGWGGTDLRGAFETRFGLPTRVENDVNALALGEQRFGAARGKKIALFLALGTGVGGALLIDGKIYHGAHWAGGEFGHLIIDSADITHYDPRGQVVTLETRCSGEGLIASWRALTGDTKRITGEELARRSAEDPHSDAAQAIRATGVWLGVGLTSLANILDPEIIIIGGGLATLGGRLLEPARQVLRTRALPGAAACPVVTAALGDNASVIGAASVAMESSDA